MVRGQNQGNCSCLWNAAPGFSQRAERTLPLESVRHLVVLSSAPSDETQLLSIDSVASTSTRGVPLGIVCFEAEEMQLFLVRKCYCLN